MKKYVPIFATAMLCQVIFAAIPPMSKSALRASSSDIVYGKVLSQDVVEEEISHGVEYDYISEVEVYVLDKWENVEDGEVIKVRYRRLVTDWSGPVGQNILPKVGEYGTFHLRIQDDGTYRIVEPNGFDNYQRHGSGNLGDVCSEDL